MRFFARLRNQLILSHLVAIAFTLIAMVGAVVFIATSWFANQQGAADEPTQAARLVAGAMGGMITHQTSSTDVSVVLRAMVTGDLRLAFGPSSFAPQSAQSRFSWPGPTLGNADYVVVIGSEGQLLGSSEPPSTTVNSSERSDWFALGQAALSGERDPRRLTRSRSAGTGALGASPIVDDNGRPVGAVIVALRPRSAPGSVGSFWNSLAIFGAASAVVLAAASVFALVAASIVGYLLSRRLVRRLEQLGQATEKLAGGDLTLHVDEGPPDEVGQLARRFNAMARQLASTVGQLESARARTEATLAAKRELVANVSHELRTPLSLIRGHVESLGMTADDVASERQRDYLAVVQRETENLSRLIDDLFALSTAEAGALPLNLEAVALADVVEEVASGIRAVARRERQISIVTAIAPDLPPARADRRRVVQILGNLVRNALRHTPEGGLIAVRVEARDGWIVTTVEDTGGGIPTERVPHVFERFYRGDDSRDRVSGGAGLGLAIVRELVEAMGGDVSVESVIGEGSRFCFRLPTVASLPP